VTRQTKTPQQRAQEQLEVAERAVSRLTEKWTAAENDARRLKVELEQASRRRDYLAQHPDLPTANRKLPTGGTNPQGDNAA